MCKVILVFRFGPRLGLKTEDLGQAEQKCPFCFANFFMKTRLTEKIEHTTTKPMERLQIITAEKMEDTSHSHS